MLELLVGCVFPDLQETGAGVAAARVVLGKLDRLGYSQHLVRPKESEPVGVLTGEVAPPVNDIDDYSLQRVVGERPALCSPACRGRGLDESGGLARYGRLRSDCSGLSSGNEGCRRRFGRFSRRGSGRRCDHSFRRPGLGGTGAPTFPRHQDEQQHQEQDDYYDDRQYVGISKKLWHLHPPFLESAQHIHIYYPPARNPGKGVLSTLRSP